MKVDYYSTYGSFQGWSDAPDASHDLYYKLETADLGLEPGSKIIELGFGEGRFLDFARRSRYDARGTEIIPELVLQAEARGHNVRTGSIRDYYSEAGSFDLVVAIDVVEHFSLDEIREFFEEVAHLLRVGGNVLLRFPNGNSPFSMPLYNSDVTHRMHLNGASLSQICVPLGFEVVRVGNQKRAIIGGLGIQVRRRIQFALRSCIELLISAAYFGHRVPLDSNLVAVFRKLPDHTP